MFLALNIFKNSDATSALGEGAGEISDLAVAIFGKFIDVLEGAAVIVCGFIVVHALRRYFARIEVEHEHQRTALNLLEKITNGFVIIVAITLGLKVIGLDLTLLISVLTLGLSFGLRDVIKNYVAGILILFKSPFKIGDIVKIRSFVGKIIQIEFQAITIKTFDNKDVTIYNKDILTQPITNYSRHDQRRLEICVQLGYGSDLARAVKIIEEIMKGDENVLKEPKYSVYFKSFENAGTLLRVRFWVKYPCNILKIQSGLAYKMQSALDEENMYAPYVREVDGTYAMTQARKERLKVLYAQPELAAIVAGTGFQTAGVTGGAVALADSGLVGAAPTAAAAGAAVTAIMPGEESTENYADAEEPE